MATAIDAPIDSPTLSASSLVPMVTVNKGCGMEKKMVLLVDDDENTLIFTRFALKHMESAPGLRRVSNGLQAMQYLQGSGLFADRRSFPLPDIILLDLKMPVMDGFEFLAWLRSHPIFNQRVVVVLTGSTYQPDLARARQLGANGFVEKSSELLDFEKSLRETLNQLLQLVHQRPQEADLVTTC